MSGYVQYLHISFCFFSTGRSEGEFRNSMSEDEVEKKTSTDSSMNLGGEIMACIFLVS